MSLVLLRVDFCLVVATEIRGGGANSSESESFRKSFEGVVVVLARVAGLLERDGGDMAVLEREMAGLRLLALGLLSLLTRAVCTGLGTTTGSGDEGSKS